MRKRIRAVFCILLVMAMLFSENSIAVFADTVSAGNLSANGIISLNAASSNSANSANGLSKNSASSNKKKDTQEEDNKPESGDKTVSPDEAVEDDNKTTSPNEAGKEEEKKETGLKTQAVAEAVKPTLSMDEAKLTVSYDGKEHALPEIELKGVSQELKEKYSISYNYTKPGTNERVTTKDVPSFKAAGTYSISVNVVSANKLVELDGDDIVDKVYKNFDLKIEPREVVITSDSYSREYDGNEVVSHNAVIGTEADRTVLSADGIKLELQYTGMQKVVGSSENEFFITSPEEATLTNYKFVKKYGTLTVTPKSQDVVSRNSLGEPTNVKAVLGADGSVKVSWKGVKSYPNAGYVTDKDMKKTRYLVYKYDKDSGSFALLTKNAASGEPQYITSASYKDTSLALKGGFLYKVEAYGIDVSGKYGAGTPAYAVANTKAYSARPFGEYEGLLFEFSDVGADSYVIERTYTYNKVKSVEEITVKRSELTQETYQGSGAKYETASLIYKDKGAHITGTAYKGVNYAYRVKAASMKLSDGTINGQTAETPYSNKVSGKVAAESVKLLSVSSDGYNSAYVQWEASNKVSQNSEYPKDSWYAIYRSTSKTTGFKKVLALRGSNIKEVIGSGRLSYNGVSYTYHFTDLTPETTYYYKVQLVYKNSYLDSSGKLKTMTTTTAMSEALSVKPTLEDIKEFKVAASTTGGVSVSIDAVDGADSYMVYYVRLSDYAHTASVNASSRAEMISAFKVAAANAKEKNANKIQKKKIKGNVNTKTGYVNASITGLTHGSTYVFYANPIKKNEHITDPDKIIYDTQMVKAGAPTVTAKVDSLTKLTFTWSKVSGATGYYIKCTNEYGEVVTPSGFAYSKSTRAKLKDIYNKRKIVIEDAEPGVLYTCEVTPYRSDSQTTEAVDENKGIGLKGETGSASEMGRPFEPTDVKASFYEGAYTVGSVSADAEVTWKDNSKNSKHSGDIKYMLTRRLYSYNKKTKNYDIQVGTDTVLIDMKTSKKVYKYQDKSAHQIPYNTVAEYAVAAVYYNKKDKTIGENHDGYVRGLEGKVRYMNPTEIKMEKSSYTVAAGGKVDTNVTVKPTPDKVTVNDAVGYRFQVEEYDSKDKEYYLRGDSSSLAAKYVYMSSDDLHARDATIPDKYRIYLVAFSKNDPSIVAPRVRVKVSKKDSESKSSSSKSESNDSDLVVMIDAGHGGSDSGATSSGVKEKDLNLQYAKKVKEELESRGAKVYMTRSDDTYISLTDRTQKAKDKGCNLFVSLHMNSGGASGTEVYYSVNSKYAKKQLASKLAENISGALGINNRGAKTRSGDNGDYYSVIRTSASHGIPGLIVEHGFIDNSTDRSALQNYIDRAASEEARTIVKYWNQ